MSATRTSRSFDSIEGVALAKRELIEALPPDGVAVLNADDPRVAAVPRSASGPHGHLRLFRRRRRAGEDVELRRRWRRASACGGVRFESPLAGRHGVLNVLAGHRGGRRLRHRAGAADGSRAHACEPGRCAASAWSIDGITILNDCYNSNPEAVARHGGRAAGTPARRRIAVLGEMLELGRSAEPLHRDVGQLCRGVAGLMCSLGYAALPATWSRRPCARACRRRRVLFRRSRRRPGICRASLAREGDAILFKGSRGVAVEQALERLLALSASESCCTACSTSSCFPSSARSASFGYVTFRTAFASLTALFLCIVLGPVADRQAARIPDRTAHPRGRAEVAPEESRHADHGRRPDHDLDRDPDAALGGPAQSLCLGGAVRPGELRRHRLFRRLRQDPQAPQPGLTARQEVRCCRCWWLSCSAASAAGDARARRSTRPTSTFRSSSNSSRTC